MAKTSDRERKARIAADTEIHGCEKAAQIHRISARTCRRMHAHAMSGADPELTAIVTKKTRAVLESEDVDWAATSRRFLRRSIAKLEELVQQAGPDQIRQVAGAIKIVGELDVVRSALRDEQSERAGQGPTPPRDAEGTPAATGYLQ